jgi:polysaccharide biosynthesis protein PslL
MTPLRNPTLDIAKGIGIILVVLGHNPNLAPSDGVLWRVIFSFHMPLFFFLSGVFLRADTPWADFARARFHSLLKPYVVVMGAVWMVSWTQPSVLSPAMRALGIAYGTGTSLAWEPAWTTLWFLPHLFVASAIGLALIKAVTGQPRARLWLTAMAVVSVSLGALYIETFAYTDRANWSLTDPARFPGLPWSLDLAPLSVAYLLMGYVGSEAARTLRFKPLVLSGAALGFALLCTAWPVRMDLNLRVYSPGLIATVQAALGICTVMQLASAVTHWPRLPGMPALGRALAYTGSGTLFLLLFHSFFQGKGLSGLARHWGALPLPTLGPGLLALTAAIALPLAAWAVCQRVPPLRRWLLP